MGVVWGLISPSRDVPSPAKPTCVRQHVPDTGMWGRQTSGLNPPLIPFQTNLLTAKTFLQALPLVGLTKGFFGRSAAAVGESLKDSPCLLTTT